MKKKSILYIIAKPIIVFFVKCFLTPKFKGLENIPKDGRFILAGTHTNNLDCLLLICSTKREVHFLAKQELFKGKFGFIFRNNGPGGDYIERLINLIEIFDGNHQIIIREGGHNNNNNNPVEADEQSLRQLQDMGFPEDRARQALINSRNDINRATEMLLGEEAE